jgi:hypothetical protein
MIKKIICFCILVSLFISLSSLSGCIRPGKTSYTTILISDAPSENFSHIYITFSQVKVHKVGLDNSSEGWISIGMEPKTVDMIYLHEYDLSEILGTQNLSVGLYSKLWIVIDDATGILKDTGEDIVFDVPSGDVKYQKPFIIIEGSTTIDIEIDLDKSVLYVPEGGIWKLLPVISDVEIEHGD